MKIISVLLIGMVLGQEIPIEAKKNQIEASVIDKGIKPTEAKKKIDISKLLGALLAGLSGGHGSGEKQAKNGDAGADILQLLGPLLGGKNQTKHDALSTIQIKSVKSSSSSPSSSSSSSPGVLKVMELMSALESTKNATLIKAAYQIIAEAEEKANIDIGLKHTEAKIIAEAEEKETIDIGIKRTEAKKKQIEAESKKNQMDTTKHIPDIATRLHGKATEQKIFTHRIKPKKNQVTNVLTKTKQARANIDIGIKRTEAKKKQIEAESKKNQIDATSKKKSSTTSLFKSTLWSGSMAFYVIFVIFTQI